MYWLMRLSVFMCVWVFLCRDSDNEGLMSVMLTFTDLEAAASGVKPAGGADISLGLAGAASADPSTLDSVGTPAASLPVAGREPNY